MRGAKETNFIVQIMSEGRFCWKWMIKDSILEMLTHWNFFTILLYWHISSLVMHILCLLKVFNPFELPTMLSGSVAQSCLTLRPMNCSTPGLPLHHQLPEFTQTHVHQVSDAIQPSHPLSSPSPPALNLSQHHGLFKWVSSSHQVAKFIGVSASTSVLPMNTQDWSPLGWTGWISLQSKGLSRVFCNTTVQKHHFFSAQLSLQSNSHIHIWPLEKP